MSVRVTKLMRVDDSRKFDTFNDAEKEANRIREKVKREAEQKDYAVQMLIGISDMDGNAKMSKPPHLHTMFYACPCETVLAMIVSYINSFERKRGRKSAATKHNCDSGYIPYIVRQSRKIRCFEHDPNGILNSFNIVQKAKRETLYYLEKDPAKQGANPVEQNKQGLGNNPRVINRPSRPGACERNRHVGDGAGEGRPTMRKKVRKNTAGGYARSKEKRQYADLITRDEWFTKTTYEKAAYFNSTRMSLNFFAYKMHLTKQSILDDFKRNSYLYCKYENKFKSRLLFHLGRLELMRFDLKMRKNLINLDD